ncbi:hypothetical protein BpHYR1_048712 [Brachionus plicatilis]|uniref:CxC5 like cysteine cluster associated with KDZ domain-containing protein n=1 Tax=Brachionus plicatilis TaxID=10195 RepID=A0A3M7S0X5_BRAPC|nr:hypothetical protein BpHYR1_048712 [Brachionus plicatilis]
MDIGPFKTIEELLIFYRIYAYVNAQCLEQVCNEFFLYTGKHLNSYDIQIFVNRVQNNSCLNPLKFFEDLQKLENYLKNRSLRTVSCNFNYCFYCIKQKLEIFNSFNTVMYTSENGPLNCIYSVKYCQNCRLKLTSDILFKKSSFKSFTSAYNYYNFNLKLTAELDENLLDLNKKLLPYFCRKWSGDEHKKFCKRKDCRKVLSVDGNYKINRLKCLNSESMLITPEFAYIIYLIDPISPDSWPH